MAHTGWEASRVGSIFDRMQLFMDLNEELRGKAIYADPRETKFNKRLYSDCL